MAEHEDDKLSLAMLVRFYVASSFSVMILFSMIGLRYPHVCIYFWIPSGIFGFYFVFRPGTFREKVLKFFFLWPFRTSEDAFETSNIDRFDQVVWFFRFAFTTIAISGSMGLWEDILERIITSSLGAGLHEEAYKLLLTGTIFMIPKYSRSRLALLYVSFIVGLGFGFAENVGYMMQESEPITFIRFISMFAHSGFNFSIALAVARQRDCIVWWIELLVGISCAIAWHAGSNYIITVAAKNENNTLSVLWYFIAKPIMTYGIFFLILTIQSVYPFKLRLRCQSKNAEGGDATPHVSSYPESETPTGTITAKDDTASTT